MYYSPGGGRKGLLQQQGPTLKKREEEEEADGLTSETLQLRERKLLPEKRRRGWKGRRRVFRTDIREERARSLYKHTTKEAM